MKKLLLLINSAYICFLFSSCYNSQAPITENAKEIKTTINDSALAKDTTQISSKTSVSGIVGSSQGVTKDTSKKSVKTNSFVAPNHNAPDQEKIDSIKKAKLKGQK